MLQKNDIEILRKLFSQHNYIMTTAELRILEKAKLLLSIAYSPMRFFVWKQLFSTTATAIEILLSGILQLIKMFQNCVPKSIIHLLRRTVLNLRWLHLEKPVEKLILLMSVFMTVTVPFMMCCEI